MAKRLISALCILASIAVVAPLAHATGVGNGTVTAIGTSTTSVLVTITVTGATGMAPCGTLGNYQFDASTAQGKALLSVVEGALLSGKRIGLGGTGNCPTTPTTFTSEGLSVITVYSN